MKIRKVKIDESTLHSQIIQWFAAQYGSKGMLVHIPNENPRGLNPLQAIKFNNSMKKLGRVKGFPDLLLLSRNGVAFIELKSTTGRLSDEQKDTLNRIESIGYKTAVIRSFDEAVVFISSFMYF